MVSALNSRDSSSWMITSEINSTGKKECMSSGLKVRNSWPTLQSKTDEDEN
jgi:hypothetical protein